MLRKLLVWLLFSDSLVRALLFYSYVHYSDLGNMPSHRSSGKLPLMLYLIVADFQLGLLNGCFS